MPDFAFAELAIYYFIAINFLAFAAFGWDKAQAESGGWRVRESTLVSLALLGGLPGALGGRALFRHKTRKKAFAENLYSAAFTGCALLGGGYYVSTQTPKLTAALFNSPEEQAQMDALMASTYYSGCNDVRAAGKAPLYYGEPGYREGMDGDGDGIACEDY